MQKYLYIDLLCVRKLKTKTNINKYNILYYYRLGNNFTELRSANKKYIFSKITQLNDEILHISMNWKIF